MNDIIHVVGIRRTLGIVLLSLFCLGVGATIYYYILPEQEAADQKLAKTNRENRELRVKIDEIPQKFAEAKANQARYDALQARGYINSQDRVLARKTIDVLRQNSEIVSLNYRVSPLETLPEGRLQDTGKRLVRSEIGIDIFDYTDLPVLTFSDMAYKTFPGVPVLTEYRIQRVDLPTMDVLQTMADRADDTFFMSGVLTFDWYTLAPKEEIDPYGQDEQEGR